MDRKTVDAVLNADQDNLGRVHHGGDDTSRLDFSANTNPQTPRGTAQVFESALAESYRYPPEEYPAYRTAAADRVGCEPADVIPTAGATEAIRLAIQTSLTPGDRVLLPSPSYGEYTREIRLQGAETTFRAPSTIAEADPSQFELVVVCQPNNPTGEASDPGQLRTLADRCAAVNTTLLVDESFIDFTTLPTLAGRTGTIVARSLTKIFGLPGLRMGFAVATGQHRDRLAAARPPWTLSSPAAAVGTYCLGEDEFIKTTQQRVATERNRMQDRLSNRFDVTDSSAPFLLFDVGDVDAVDEVLAETDAHGIAVRDARTFRQLDSHIRVAVRLPEENERLLESLDV